MFSSVLIANRGEIACRIAATCRRLGVRAVAVHSEADSEASHVKACDAAYVLGPAPARESYLNPSALLRIIRGAGVEAVHPGYGFLSENASFASEVEAAGVTFVGPSAEALRLLSDKLVARQTAKGAGFEPVPGSEESASDCDREALRRTCELIGFPVLIKAAGGGGGIGMQRANDFAQLAAAIERAAGIAERSFADARVYIEKYVERPRHVEIQTLRARNGFTAVLGNRECSVQRRYQKLIEECPSPLLLALGPERLRSLECAACRLLELVDYVGVATVELLVGEEGHPYFLEVNARLQVEHTVTEMVYGADLVELQLRLAAGEDVSSMVARAKPAGHAVEARVYAEDPAKGFLPQPGVVEVLELPHGNGVRVDCGIEVGTVVSPYYDPLLAKIIGWGDTRASATEVLRRSLEATKISVRSKNGVRANNLAFLQSVLSTADWQTANYDTTLVERLVMTAAGQLELFERARQWAASDPDLNTSAQLRECVESGNEQAVRDCFEPPMEFGTAGLRGVVGPGPARMNLAVIRRVSRALADEVQHRLGPGCKVVVGCDARLDSERFSRESAAVIAAAGCEVLRFGQPVATPLVAFAALREHAGAGVVVTASHNPPEYNGYKVYGCNAIQIVPPFDLQIAERMQRLGPANAIATELPRALSTNGPSLLGGETLALYRESVLQSRPAHVPFPLRIAYTPLHGVGWQHAEDVLLAAGYADLHAVASQVKPDGQFPTVRFPNPEEPGTLKLGMEFASQIHAQILIANDPDADRLALALPDEAGLWHALSGNQLGIILTDYLLERASGQSKRPLVVSTVVSTPMFDLVAAARQAQSERTLTGFKWLWTAALELLKDETLQFAIAWEEALGYSTHTAVRDKDGIAAALIAADWAAACLSSGELPYNRLGRAYREHGAWASRQVNITKTGIEGARELKAAFARFGAEPPRSVLGSTVSRVEDYRVGAEQRPFWRGLAELVILHLSDGSRVLARPSGTEPKLKLYLDVPEPVGSSEDPFDVLRTAEARADEIGRVLLEWLGG